MVALITHMLRLMDWRPYKNYNNNVCGQPQPRHVRLKTFLFTHWLRYRQDSTIALELEYRQRFRTTVLTTAIQQLNHCYNWH